MGEMTALGILEPLATNCLDHRSKNVRLSHYVEKLT